MEAQSCAKVQRFSY